MERANEFAGAGQCAVVVADAGYKHVPNPDGLVDFVQVAEKVDDVFVSVSGEFFMDNVVYVLDIYEQKVGRLHQPLDFCECFTGAPKRDSARVDACVDSGRFCKLEKLHHEIKLCERLAAADGNAAVLAPVCPVAERFFE